MALVLFYFAVQFFFCGLFSVLRFYYTTYTLLCLLYQDNINSPSSTPHKLKTASLYLQFVPFESVIFPVHSIQVSNKI
jgi:hypothetical protein